MGTDGKNNRLPAPNKNPCIISQRLSSRFGLRLSSLHVFLVVCERVKTIIIIVNENYFEQFELFKILFKNDIVHGKRNQTVHCVDKLGVDSEEISRN